MTTSGQDPRPEPVRFVLELSRGRNPVEGTISLDDTERPFTGWMELVTVLEEVSAADKEEEPA